MNYKLIRRNSAEYPAMLKYIKDPPKQLYCMGDTRLLNEPCFAIIGSRSCTEKGEKLAERMAMELCEYNLCIVSGMALGIDSAAHRRCNFSRW